MKPESSNILKDAIQFLANSLGYEIRAHSSTAAGRRHAIMDRLGIDLVLDVGANAGQYGSALRRVGYKGRIWSFEPLSDAFASLEASARGDALWRTEHFGCGASRQAGTINVAKNSYSSSLLPMLGMHLENAPGSEYVRTEEVELVTLDETTLPSLKDNDRVWLKIDAQGFEHEVLAGAKGLLRLVQGIECELSTTMLYDHQLLIDQMFGVIYAAGFRLVEFTPAFYERGNPYLLQGDGLFVRNC